MYRSPDPLKKRRLYKIFYPKFRFFNFFFIFSDNGVSSPLDPIFSSTSFLPPISGDDPISVPSRAPGAAPGGGAVFPSAHDFQLPKKPVGQIGASGVGFPSPIGRKKASWDSNMGNTPLAPERNSPGTPPSSAPIGTAIKSIGTRSGHS